MPINKVKSSLLNILYITTTAIFTYFFIFMAIFLFTYERGEANTALIVFAVLTVIFAFFSRKFKKKYQASQSKDIDNTILKIVTEHKGLITAVELASETSYGLMEAAEHLERNYQLGHCDKKFTQETLVEVYHFKQAVSATEKMSAVNVSELSR